MTRKPNFGEYQKLLEKYSQGKCTEKELQILDEWYNSFDNDVHELDAKEIADLKAEMFNNISAGIEREEGSFRKPGPSTFTTRFKSINIYQFARIAAVLVLAVAVGIVVYLRKDRLDGHLAGNVDPVERAGVKNAPQVKGPATIYLSDGSVVWLKEKSRLDYPETFADGIREVILVGEAFFDVAPDKKRPFIIRSANFTTRVVGTTFKIKDYENEESQEVEVVTGKVIVSVRNVTGNSVKELVLKPNRKAIYSKKDNSLVEANSRESDLQQSFTKSKLVFNEVPLKDIIAVLNVTHDVNITFANESMKRCILTADFTDETLEVSLAILSRTTNAKFDRSGRDILLSGPGCDQSE